jgi:SnoaL-like domain
MKTNAPRTLWALTVALGLVSTQSAFAQSNAREAFAQAAPEPSLKQMTPVDRLLAIEDIKQLPLRYCRCVSQKDWDCWRDLFAPDFYYDVPGLPRTQGPDGIIELMRTLGPYDRLVSVFYSHGAEIELLSPTKARGVWAADYMFYYPPNQKYPTTGKEVVAPGQQTHTYTYYYQTYEKIGGQWKIKTSDHISNDLRRDSGPGISIPTQMPPPKFPDRAPPRS